MSEITRNFLRSIGLTLLSIVVTVSLAFYWNVSRDGIFYVSLFPVILAEIILGYQMVVTSTQDSRRPSFIISLASSVVPIVYLIFTLVMVWVIYQNEISVKSAVTIHVLTFFAVFVFLIVKSALANSANDISEKHFSNTDRISALKIKVSHLTERMIRLKSTDSLFATGAVQKLQEAFKFTYLKSDQESLQDEEEIDKILNELVILITRIEVNASSEDFVLIANLCDDALIVLKRRNDRRSRRL